MFIPDLRAAIIATIHVSINAPFRSKQIKSAYKHQADLSGNIHNVFKSKHCEFFRISATNWVAI